MAIARVRLIPGIAVTAALCAGCASRPVNDRIDAVDPEHGYRLEISLANRTNNDPRTAFALAFSGGGTRAAALSYGVLEALRSKEIVVDGQSRRLLDEVDAISGVSGGSFTALSYALYGDRLFSEYEDRFLKRDVQGALISRALNPLYWPKLVGGSYGRSELAADYYDEILFEGSTYADLLSKNAPITIVTATDISTGAKIEFSQSVFDALCSNLLTMRLSRAVASSSAVPLAFSPVTLNNYGGTCGFEFYRRVEYEMANPSTRARPAERALMRLREHRDLERSAERPYIHLVDGGVSDNLGLRGILEAFELLEASPASRKIFGFDHVDRIAIIVVDAHARPRVDWDRHEAPPGIVSQVVQASGVPIDHYSYESVQLIKDTVERWQMQAELDLGRTRHDHSMRAEAEARRFGIALFTITVSFESIADPKERDYFMNLPTSLSLPREAIDRIRRVAGELLDASPDFNAFVRDFGRH
jgi:NTE family protein